MNNQLQKVNIIIPESRHKHCIKKNSIMIENRLKLPKWLNIILLHEFPPFHTEANIRGVFVQ